MFNNFIPVSYLSLHVRRTIIPLYKYMSGWLVKVQIFLDAQCIDIHNKNLRKLESWLKNYYDVTQVHNGTLIRSSFIK